LSDLEVQLHLVLITVYHKVEDHLHLEFLQLEEELVVNLEFLDLNGLLDQVELVDPEAAEEESADLFQLQVDQVIIHQHHLHKEILADQEQMLQETGEEPEAVAEEPLNQEPVLLVHTILEMEETELEQQ
jgi:hypothetical protein